MRFYAVSTHTANIAWPRNTSLYMKKSKPTEKIKDLGKWFDEKLTLKEHINDKINVAYMMLGLIDVILNM